MHKIETLSSTHTILAVGDSLTYGFGAPVESSYPVRLHQKVSMKVINAGENGETSSEGLLRLPSLLNTYHPKLTILCYGGNDILQKRSMRQLKENLKKMITLCKEAGSEVRSLPYPI